MHLGGLLRPQPENEPLPQAEGRWQSQLRPDLRRAAPDIYLNFRFEGVANMREWMAREFDSQRGTEMYSDFWHLATEVDFMLDRCRTEPARVRLV